MFGLKIPCFVATNMLRNVLKIYPVISHNIYSFFRCIKCSGTFKLPLVLFVEVSKASIHSGHPTLMQVRPAPSTQSCISTCFSSAHSFIQNPVTLSLSLYCTHTLHISYLQYSCQPFSARESKRKKLPRHKLLIWPTGYE